MRCLYLLLLVPALALAAVIESVDNSPQYRWDDIQVSATQGVGAAALTTATYGDHGAAIEAMSSVGTDALTLYAQMSHGWARTAVKPHIHWVPLATPNANATVRFTGAYGWSCIGGSLPSVEGWTTFTQDVEVTAGLEMTQVITGIATVAPPSCAGNSTFLVIHLTRDGASATDDYTDGGPSNVGILGVDVHYQANTFGSVVEY